MRWPRTTQRRCPCRHGASCRRTKQWRQRPTTRLDAEYGHCARRKCSAHGTASGSSTATNPWARPDDSRRPEIEDRSRSPRRDEINRHPREPRYDQPRRDDVERDRKRHHYRPPPVIIRPYFPPPVYLPPPVYAPPYYEAPRPWVGPVPAAVIWDLFPRDLYDSLSYVVRTTHERVFVAALTSEIGVTQSWRSRQLRGEITVIDEGFYGSSFCRDVVQTIRTPWFKRTADGRVCLRRGQAWRLVTY